MSTSPCPLPLPEAQAQSLTGFYAKSMSSNLVFLHTSLNTLMADKAGRYQICGPSAFSRYGFDEQIPKRVYAYNNSISGERTTGSLALRLIKVADERLGDTESFETADGQRAFYSSRVRSLVDSVYDWARFDSLPLRYQWIRGELAAKKIRAAKIRCCSLKSSRDKKRSDGFHLL